MILSKFVQGLQIFQKYYDLDGFRVDRTRLRTKRHTSKHMENQWEFLRCPSHS